MLVLHFDIDLYPQQLLTAAQAAAGAFFVERRLLQKGERIVVHN